MTNEQMEIVANPRSKKKWWVYLFVDPRNDQPFYVGITCDVPQRLLAHANDVISSAYRRIGNIRKAGSEPEMVILGEYKTKAEAIDHETSIIAQDWIGGCFLLNKTGYAAVRPNSCSWVRSNPKLVEQWRIERLPYIKRMAEEYLW